MESYRSPQAVRKLVGAIVRDLRFARARIASGFVGFLLGFCALAAVSLLFLVPGARLEGARQGRFGALREVDQRIEDAYFRGAFDVVTGRLAVSTGIEREYVVIKRSDGDQRQLTLTPMVREDSQAEDWSDMRLRVSQSELLSADRPSDKPGGALHN